MYDEDPDKSSWLSGGDGETEVPKRQGSRPKTGWHCIPHRQIDQIPSDDVKEVSIRISGTHWRVLILSNS